jgi:hypothetical protein
MIHRLIDKIPFLRNRKAFIFKYKLVFGILLIVLGIAGLFLPFLQGIVLIILGVALLRSRDLINDDKKSRTVRKRRQKS